MLGRKVGERLVESPNARLFSEGVVETVGEADLFVLNLECAISDRGERWHAPGKPFFFRAPPRAATVLADLGVGCVTLANNHALDFGVQALLDTFHHLAEAGIAVAGAGPDERAARTPVVLERGGLRLAVIGVSDHPADYAAGPERAGIAFADLWQGTPTWLLDAVRAADADAVLVTPHWGPNMVATPVEHVRRAAARLRAEGATLVAGHSAHVFHGVGDAVLYDLGDFVDDYVVDPDLRNDLGLVFLVTVDSGRAIRLEAVPIALEYCYTRLADGPEAAWIGARFRRACASLGTEVSERDGRLVVEWEESGGRASRADPPDDAALGDCGPPQVASGSAHRSATARRTESRSSI